jgi:Flp pilus assembly protein TadB
MEFSPPHSRLSRVFSLSLLAAGICAKRALGVPMEDDERRRSWSGLFLVLGGLALITTLEAALTRNSLMAVFMATAGSFLLILGWITRSRTGRRSLTSRLKNK